ncbi:Alpha-ketoglutarate-dependent dioxygenase alkB 2 [Branchiostoma belcheri]|nr:Alpha-ketoglutarate-dependent dioxygenase alkB 2 [Branchiostoma belcheri]
MNHKLMMLLGLTGLLMVDRAVSECCYPSPGNCQQQDVGLVCEKVCDDETKATPYCGYGPCNIWGCNCDGGCRRGRPIIGGRNGGSKTKKGSVADPEEARSLLELLEGENTIPGYDKELERVVEKSRGLLELLRGEHENFAREHDNIGGEDGYNIDLEEFDKDMAKEQWSRLGVVPRRCRGHVKVNAPYQTLREVVSGGIKLRGENFNCDYTVLYRLSVASTLFQACEEEFVYNTGDLARVQLFGKYRDIPRKQVAFGDPGLSYRFSGVEIPAKPWSPLLRTIKDRIQEVTGQEFNFVLINRYKDGLDYIGEHRDDEEGLVQNAPIASLSLGQKRDFIFKHCDARGKYKKRVGEESMDTEPGSYRSVDIFDDTDDLSEEATTEHDTEFYEECEVSEEDESVMDSQEVESATETDSDQSGSESDASSIVSSSPAPSDESEEYGYDSGDEEEWTLYRDWTISLTHDPGDVPQRVIKETKRAGKNGCSGSGKSYFVQKLLTSGAEWLDPGPFEHVVWCYSEYQENLHSELSSKLGPKIQFQEGLPENWNDVTKPGCRNAVVIDDQMEDVVKGDKVTKLFTRASRHRGISVFLLVQNLFYQGLRTISLNSSYIVLFKSPRDQSMVTTLAKQMFPGHSKFLQECYEDAVNKKTHGHLFLDLHPESPNELRVRSGMLTSQPYVYLRK